MQIKNLYKAIKKFVFNLYSNNLQGHALARAKNLINLMYGIMRSKKSSLSGIAEGMPGRTQDKTEEKDIKPKKFASKVKQIKRWLMSQHNNYETHFFPLAVILLEVLAKRGELIFAIDGSIIGNGCIGLMISVVFQGRSLPICWVVRKGKKGHFPERMHVELLEQLKTITPDEVNIIILGDGEFDGCQVQQTCADFEWKYAFRASKSVLITQEEETFQLKDMALGALPYLFFEGVFYTAKEYGEVNVGYFHQKGYKDPLCLVTNFESIEEAHQYYKKRFLIETFFSDIKSRGFNAQKSKLEDPERISTLLIPLCLNYIFTIQQAIQAFLQELVPFLTYENKKEASLFTIGRRMLLFCEENFLKIKFSLSTFLYSKFCVPL